LNGKDIQSVVCPEGYTFIKPHMRGSTLIEGHCRKTREQKRKDLGRETVEAIPFGFDVLVAYDYMKYGKDGFEKKEGEEDD